MLVITRLLFINSTLEKHLFCFRRLSVEGGEELLSNSKNEIENIDYVQMAHHGQAGVTENVYRVINPKYCLGQHLLVMGK